MEKVYVSRLISPLATGSRPKHDPRPGDRVPNTGGKEGRKSPQL